MRNNCSGRAVTLELLRNTFTSASINPLWLHAVRGEGRPGRHCPSCRNVMTQVDLSENKAVNVDVCRICHFVWFDSHEIERLTPSRPTGPQNSRRKFARCSRWLKIERIERDRQGSDVDSAPPDEWWKNIAAVFGVPVEFDAPPQDRRPWITWILFVAIVGSSVLAFQHLQEVTQQFGLIPAQYQAPERTYFLHFVLSAQRDPAPLGNMYFLLVFGDDVENFLRPLRYFALDCRGRFGRRSPPHCRQSEFASPVHWSQRRNRRDCRFLRAQFSPRETRISSSLGILLVSMDSATCLVRTCSLGSFPDRQQLRANRRSDLGFFTRSSRGRSRRRCRLVAVAGAQQRWPPSGR